jgi:glutamate-5-semialdehyde dehydrogenase
MSIDTVEKTIEEMAARAQIASRRIASAPTARKNEMLETVAALLIERKAAIQEQNRKDLDAGVAGNLSSAMLDRLTLSGKVIDSMRSGLEEVASLKDPVGQINGIVTRPSGIKVGRMRIPLGVIAMIYESRPNVTIDSAALCLKSGNAIILRGGSEAIHSNIILAEILQESLASCGFDPQAVQVVPTTDRAAINHLLKQEDFIDLIIPRGGEGLIRFVSEHSRIPVLKHYKGVCHIYVDVDADLQKATPVILNSKIQRPGVCNALEGLLVDRRIAAEYLPVIGSELKKAGVELLGCERSTALSKDILPAGEDDWGTEFLDMKMCVKVVDNLEGAKAYIEKYGSRHTEAIITENFSVAQRFLSEIDASAVMVNTSTRFNDGGELGLGTEIGISTTKLHAYGPMGLEELTTEKFVVYGEGQVRN